MSGDEFDAGAHCIGTVRKEEEAVKLSAVGNGIDGVYGVVGGAAGICGDVKLGEAIIVGGDDSEP